MVDRDKSSFVVYSDIKETLDELTDDQVAKLFRAMVEYSATGEMPKFSGILKYVFIPIRQQMDRDGQKWEQKKEARRKAGQKGGQKSGEVRRAAANEANEANEAKLHKRSNASTNEASEANVPGEAVNVNGNVNVNVNGNGNGNVNGASSNAAGASLSPSLPASLVSYLNRKAGASHKVTEDVERRVGELEAAGYTEAEMRAVIDMKVAEWKDDKKMRGYLRPSTLFGAKFQEYVAAAGPAVEEARGRQASLEEAVEDLATAEEVLAEVEKAQGFASADEWKILEDRRCVMAQRVAGLKKQVARLQGGG